MKIILVPQQSSAELVLSREGDSLWLNGEEFDFSPLTEGATLPWKAMPMDKFADDANRVDGQLILSVYMPYKDPDAHESIRFPDPVVMTEDGHVPLPTEVEDEQH